MDDRKRHWNDVYRTKDDTAVSWYEDEPRVSLSLIDEAGLDLDARIIDVGAGASRLVDRLLAQGYHDITLLDLSDAALDRVRQRLPPDAPVRTVAADVLEWTPPAPVDLWHDRAVFHFLVDAQDRDRYAAVLREAVRPGGHAVIGTFAPDGPERCSGLPVHRHDEASVATVLGPSFRLIASVRHSHETPAGAQQRFVFSLFRRS